MVNFVAISAHRAAEALPPEHDKCLIPKALCFVAVQRVVF